MTALIPTAKMLHANRIVRGIAITHPLGDPGVSPEQEKRLRRKIVESALEALAKEPDKEGPKEGSS